MCLQDIKLGKLHEPRGSVVAANASASVIVIGANASRRYINLNFNADPVGLTGDIALTWIPDGTPIVIRWFSRSRPFCELSLAKEGMVVYGPFGVWGPQDAGFSIGVYETFAHSDEEVVKS